MISIGAVNAELMVGLNNGVSIVATLGVHAYESMGVGLNAPVTVLVKESAILLSATDCSSVLSTRNSMVGTVQSITAGLVNSEVVLTLASQQTLVATVARDELNQIDCQVGKQLWANFKSSDVVLATGHRFM